MSTTEPAVQWRTVDRLAQAQLRFALYRVAIRRHDLESALYQKQCRRLELVRERIGKIHGTSGTEEHKQSSRQSERIYRAELPAINQQLLNEGFLIEG